MNVREIQNVLPHRYPFLLVDKVISQEYSADPSTRVGNKIVAVKNVSVNEPFFNGHFPNLPIMPGVLQIEAMAQAACLAFQRKGDPPMDYFIAGIREAKFRKPVVPGDTLMLYGEIVRERGSIVFVKVEAKVDNQTTAEAELMAKVSPQSKRDEL
jgi:3-hydroxyacyl-[acyl-carrier-protein] dehydratase